MKESAQAALTYVRSVSDRLGAGERFFQKHDIHVHVPAGAVPKDGPSAGVAMAVALASMVSGKVVDPESAMTGEITLTGQVLPVGGIKEKVLAAQAAGLSKVFLPLRNEADVAEIEGEDLLSGIEFIYVDHVSTVLEGVLDLEEPVEAPATAMATDGHTGQRRADVDISGVAVAPRRPKAMDGVEPWATRDMSGAYVELDHPADIFLEIRGPDLPRLFENALFAFYDHVVELGERQSAPGAAPRSLGALGGGGLARLLAEALYHFETEGFVGAAAAVEVASVWWVG